MECFTVSLKKGACRAVDNVLYTHKRLKPLHCNRYPRITYRDKKEWHSYLGGSEILSRFGIRLLWQILCGFHQSIGMAGVVLSPDLPTYFQIQHPLVILSFDTTLSCDLCQCYVHIYMFLYFVRDCSLIRIPSLKMVVVVSALSVIRDTVTYENI
jgi:hypothetical protein